MTSATTVRADIEVARHMRRGFVWGVGTSCGAGAAATWASVAWLQLSMPWAASVGIVVVLLTATAISGYITHPLLELVSVTRQLGEGKLGSRMDLAVFEHGEVGLLAHAVNDMASRIETQVTDQRELLAAVSHELRTPLGHTRLLLEAARARPDKPETFDALERELVDIDRLVEQLLACSRVDFGQLRRRRFDFVLLVLRGLERHDIDASVLDVEGEPDPVLVDADATLLLAASANLLDNAQQHGGGVESVRITSRPDQVTLEVFDRGPGFDADAESHALQPFYRGTKSGGGTLGLGLSLVERIASAHGGRAWAQNRPDGGARVGFTVPRPTVDP